MRSVLVLTALAILFPRRTDYYPVMYKSFEDTGIFLLDILYSLNGSALAALSTAVRFSLTFKRRIKSHLPFAGIIRSSPYSPSFQDKG